MPIPAPDRQDSATDAAEQALIDALRARGQRVTSQRLVLYRTLRELGRHASVEELVQAASGSLPGLSAPTVYATMDLFEELGLVRRVAAGGATLFDPRADGHLHFGCRRCGRVIDVEADPDLSEAIAAAGRAGLRAQRAEVMLTGICPDCEASGADGRD
jgi:Fe2+ or Zn2+ uptake regulation protein